MKLYHGTSKLYLKSILANGVDAPSYWGTRDQALEYAASFGNKGILLSADIDPDDLKASIYVAQALFDEEEIDDLPDESDIEYSLDNLGGVTCDAVVRDFEVEKVFQGVQDTPGMNL